MSGRLPRLPSVPSIDYRRVLLILGIIALFIVPTGAAFVNSSGGLFTGPEEKILIEATDGPNGQYVDISGENQLVVNLTEDNENLNASGVNPNAVTEFDRMFTITNTANESRQIWARHTNEQALTFYVEETGESLEDNVTLAPDETITVGLRVDTRPESVTVNQLLVTTLYIGDRTAPLSVDAGGPYFVDEGDTVALSGEGSSGDIASYAWEITSGPDGASLQGADTATPTFVAPDDVPDDVAATVELTITGPDGNTETATTTVTVLDNIAPNADAGGPYEVEANTTLRLDGTGSFDPDGAIESYEWTITSGPGSLSNPAVRRPTYTPPSSVAANTTVTVELNVTDDGGAFDTDTTAITVYPENEPPTIDVGGPFRVAPGESLPIDDVTATDPDGDIVSYAWTVADGGGSLSDADDAVPTYTAPDDAEPGTNVTLRVTVTDDDSATRTATVPVSVVEDQPPIADAGGPYEVEANATITLDGTGSSVPDDDGEITAYTWTITSGPGSLSDADTSQPTYAAPPDVGANTTVTVELNVTGEDGEWDTDSATLTVYPANQPPTVDVGGPYTVGTGSSIPLNGSTFEDPDGNITNIEWSIVAGSGSLSNRNAEVPTYTAPDDLPANGTVTVAVTVTDDDGATTTVRTTVEIVEAVLTVVGTSNVQFGEVPVDETANETVTVRNDGDTPVTIDGTRLAGAQAGQFELVAGAPPVTLDPGETHTFTVEFDPTGGPATATMNVLATDDGSGVRLPALGVSLNGTGIGPNLVLSRSSITYQQIGIGLVINETVTVGNNGTSPLTVTAAEIAGSGADQYRLAPEIDGPFTLDVGETRTFTVTFAPADPGAFTPELRFESNDPDEPTKSVALRGTGLPPHIDVSTDLLNFGNVTVGRSKVLDLTVSNPGDPPINLSVSQTTILGPNRDVFEIVDGGAPFVLGPGEERTIQIRYSPQSPGIKTAQLRILSDAANNQIDVWMSNTGWRIIVQQTVPGSRGVDADTETWDPPEPNDANTSQSEMDANDVPPGVSVTVNVSVPSTRKDPATVEEVTVNPNVRVGSNATFDMYFLHNENGPPMRGDVRYQPDPGRRVVEYISVEHTIPNSQLSDTSFTFEVDKDAFGAEVIPDVIEVKHRVGDEWETLDAQFVRERRNDLVYRVDTPGFSQFAVTGPNAAPVADAGPDATVAPGNGTGLDGTDSRDPDGKIKRYEWTIVSGPGSLSGADTSTPTYRAPADAGSGDEVRIRLTVTDNDGTTGTDTVTVTVAGGGSGGGNETDLGGTPGATTPDETPAGNATDPGDTGDAPGGNATGNVTPGQTVSTGGVTIRFDQPEDGGDTIPNLADVISISDLALPDPSADRDGPRARIESGGIDESATEAVGVNESGVGLRVSTDEEVAERLEAGGADALTLVGEPITLDGSHSLFSSKESIEDDWRTVRRLSITVPPEYRDRAAVMTIEVPRSRFGDTDPSEATVARHGDGYQLLTTEVVDASGDVVVLRTAVPDFTVSEFAVLARNSVAYAWTVETYDEPFSGSRIEPAFDEPGFYNVSLTVTDAFGRTDTANYTVLANDVPRVGIDWSGPVPLDEPIVLSASVEDEIGNVTLVWILPDGTRKTGRTINHTFAPGTAGEIVVVAEDEFGAQGRGSLRVGGSGGLDRVDLLSYGIVPGRAIWLLGLLGLLLLLLVLLRRFGWPAILSRGHPPTIEVFELPSVDVGEQWVVIPRLAVTDDGEDLDRIDVAVIEATEGRTVGHEFGDIDGGDRYEDDAIVIRAADGEHFEAGRAYVVRVTVSDEAGNETERERRTAADGFVFVSERPSQPGTPFETDREPGDD